MAVPLNSTVGEETTAKNLARKLKQTHTSRCLSLSPRRSFPHSCLQTHLGTVEEKKATLDATGGYDRIARDAPACLTSPFPIVENAHTLTIPGDCSFELRGWEPKSLQGRAIGLDLCSTISISYGFQIFKRRSDTNALHNQLVRNSQRKSVWSFTCSNL